MHLPPSVVPIRDAAIADNEIRLGDSGVETMRTRVAQQTYLRFQIRCHVKRERSLLYLLSKACEGNHADAEHELIRVRRHKQEAEKCACGIAAE